MREYDEKVRTTEDTQSDEENSVWSLRLYVAGQTPESLEAFANLKKICDEHLKGRCSMDVIDLKDNPHLAREDGIIAIPTLIKKLPPPIKKIVGTLTDTERVLVGLNIPVDKQKPVGSHNE